MNEAKQFVLMEVCCTQDCTEFAGGWKVKKSTSKSDLEKLTESIEPGECPGCGDQLSFEIWENLE